MKGHHRSGFVADMTKKIDLNISPANVCLSSRS